MAAQEDRSARTPDLLGLSMPIERFAAATAALFGRAAGGRGYGRRPQPWQSPAGLWNCVPVGRNLL